MKKSAKVAERLVDGVRFLPEVTEENEEVKSAILDAKIACE